MAGSEHFPDGTALWVKWSGKWYAATKASDHELNEKMKLAKPKVDGHNYVLVFYYHTHSYAWAALQNVLPICEEPEPLGESSHAIGRNLASDPSVSRREMLHRVGACVLDVCDRLHVKCTVREVHTVAAWQAFAERVWKCATYPELGRCLVQLARMISPNNMTKKWKDTVSLWESACRGAQGTEALEELIKRLKGGVDWDAVQRVWDEEEEQGEEWDAWRGELWVQWDNEQEGRKKLLLLKKKKKTTKKKATGTIPRGKALRRRASGQATDEGRAQAMQPAGGRAGQRRAHPEELSCTERTRGLERVEAPHTFDSEILPEDKEASQKEGAQMGPGNGGRVYPEKVVPEAGPAPQGKEQGPGVSGRLAEGDGGRSQEGELGPASMPSARREGLRDQRDAIGGVSEGKLVEAREEAEVGRESRDRMPPGAARQTRLRSKEGGINDGLYARGVFREEDKMSGRDSPHSEPRKKRRLGRSREIASPPDMERVGEPLPDAPVNPRDPGLAKVPGDEAGMGRESDGDCETVSYSFETVHSELDEAEGRSATSHFAPPVYWNGPLCCPTQS